MKKPHGININHVQRDALDDAHISVPKVEISFYESVPPKKAGQRLGITEDQNQTTHNLTESNPPMEIANDTEADCKTLASAHPTPLQLMRYFDKTIEDKSTMVYLEGHIANCAACQGFLGSLVIPDMSDDELLAEIYADLEQENLEQERLDREFHEHVMLPQKKLTIEDEPLVSPATHADTWSIRKSDLASIALLVENLGSQEGIDVEWAPGENHKVHYPHYMLKEIHEQPQILRRLIARCTNAGHTQVVLGDLGVSEEELRSAKHIVIQACGSSGHTGIFAKLLLEHLTDIKVSTDLVTDSSYGKTPILPPNTIVVAISQSGEYADTIAGVRAAKKQGLRVISVVNEPDSTLAAESDGVILVDAGPEIGIASTKSYTGQLAAIYLLTLYIASLQGKMNSDRMARRLFKLLTTVDFMEAYLESDSLITRVADVIATSNHAIFIGHVLGYPSAREGALKFKEVACIHAECLPLNGLQDGVINLLDRQKMPVLAMATSHITSASTYARVTRDIQKLRSHQVPVFAIADSDDKEIYRYTEHVIPVPMVAPLTGTFAPFLTALPLQLLAYHLGISRGCLVDQPLTILRDIVRQEISAAKEITRISEFKPKTGLAPSWAEGSIVVQHDATSSRVQRVRVTLDRKDFDSSPEGRRVLLRLDSGERIDMPLSAKGGMAKVQKLDTNMSSRIPVELQL